MDEGYESIYNIEHRLQDRENSTPSNSETVDDTSSLSEMASLETMITRLCPQRHEIAKDAPPEPLSEPLSVSTEAPIDETLLDLTRQLKLQPEEEILDWGQHAAKLQTILLGILNWALPLIDTVQSLKTTLSATLDRFGEAQKQVVALLKEQEVATCLRASLERSLLNAEIRTKKVEDRAMALEKENRQVEAFIASVIRGGEYLL